MLRVAICDDDEKILTDIKNLIEKEYSQKAQIVLVQNMKKAEAGENLIALCTAGEVVKINPMEVIYVESEKHLLYFHGMNGKQKFRMKMDDCLKIFPDFFIRIHQSYAVNGTYLQSIKTNQAVLFDGRELPVSRRRYKMAREKFLEYLEGK